MIGSHCLDFFVTFLVKACPDFSGQKSKRGKDNKIKRALLTKKNIKNTLVNRLVFHISIKDLFAPEENPFYKQNPLNLIPN